MSDSVWPHRRQPTRLPCPWDSPGKNTGVSCHFLLQCMKVKSESEVAQSCPTLSDPMDCSPPGSSVHGIFQARVLEGGAIAFSGRCGTYMQWNSTQPTAACGLRVIRPLKDPAVVFRRARRPRLSDLWLQMPSASDIEIFCTHSNYIFPKVPLAAQWRGTSRRDSSDSGPQLWRVHPLRAGLQVLWKGQTTTAR